MAIDGLNAVTTGALASARARVTGAIQQAASAFGASFEYLLTTAKMESDFNPAAKASTSSARGLFQFIDQTWLGTVKDAGASIGYGAYADAITKSPSGTYSVDDPATRAAILKLRDDPAVSAAMAGALTQSNSFQLTGQIGRRPSDAELYMAHFLGVGGAAKLITSAEARPSASGAAMFPSAAAANRSIFYDRAGQARSVSDVYAVLTSRYNAAANSQATRTAMASSGLTSTSVSASSAASFLSRFPDVNAVTASAQATGESMATQQPEPMFRSLFQAGARAEPVSPTVQQLWGRGASLTSTSLASTPEVRAPQPLDLFSDRFGTFSG